MSQEPDWRSGLSSTAMGGSTEASASFSTAMGRNTIASGLSSTAMGEGTTASGEASTAMGAGATASGSESTAMGSGTTASGNSSTAMGWLTTAQAYQSLALGRFNTISGSTTDWIATDPVLVVGNGTSSGSPSNAFTLLKNGDLTIAGTLTQASDARFKTDIAPLGDVLSRLGGIRGVTYRFTSEHAGPAGRQVGLLAQEVQRAFPELVHEDSEGQLSVAYGNFTAVLVPK